MDLLEFTNYLKMGYGEADVMGFEYSKVTVEKG
jgi:hypothetical protein